jgi:hypothetical protein
MKKMSIPLLAGFIALSSFAFSQSMQENKFTPAGNTSISLDFVKIGEKTPITASLFSGKLGNSDALGVQFVNSAANAVTFSYVIKDKSGKTVLASTETTLGGGMNLSALVTDRLSFPITEGQKAGDFSIEITIK